MQSYVIALYIRLSLEDSKYDSLSIENQRLVLHEYAAAMPEALHAEVLEFIDNGYSGTNFERPQVQKLIEMVRANQINCITPGPRPPMISAISASKNTLLSLRDISCPAKRNGGGTDRRCCVLRKDWCLWLYFV